MKDYVKDLRNLIGTRPLIIAGSTVLLQNPDGKILFQFRSDTKEWGLPGGAMEPGESFLETAERELHEETGLVALKYLPLGTISGKELYFQYPNGDEVYNIISVFLGTNIEGTLKINDPESLRLCYFSYEDLPEKLDERARLILETYRSSL
ncbi:NUDIX hydrolase [Halobacillus halophilus]|uniref:NUDIX hydrolase n=1 Tax=Halobacillus halophilus TaxID=1570 RepID=UPI001CD7702E|nr:NUDIX hydrolase [Halobacillus halophilus]MCA1012507.1 NUDIX hydrolase [Halobacillus halophilus]